MWGDGTVLDVDVGPNLYAYVQQNPWTNFDPLGLKTISDYEKEIDRIKKESIEYAEQLVKDGKAVKGGLGYYTPYKAHQAELNKFHDQIEATQRKIDRIQKATNVYNNVTGSNVDARTVDDADPDSLAFGSTPFESSVNGFEFVDRIGTAEKLEYAMLLGVLRGRFRGGGKKSLPKGAVAAPGDVRRIAGVRATELSGRLTPAEMATLQRQHGVEFVQIYVTGPGRSGGGGTYYLIRGGPTGARVPIGSNIRVINHTHPTVHPTTGTRVPRRPSAVDRSMMRQLRQSGSPQRQSQIVTEDGHTINFSE